MRTGGNEPIALDMQLVNAWRKLSATALGEPLTAELSSATYPALLQDMQRQLTRNVLSILEECFRTRTRDAYVCQCVAEGRVTIEYVPTKEQY